MPVTCIWEITRHCDLRCLHCENFGGQKSERELPFEKMLEVADALQKLGCRMVDLTGGEPLLHPKWDALAAALRDRGMRTSLITNGLSFDNGALARAKAADISVIGFSLDGPKPIHDRLRKRPGVHLRTESPFDGTVENIARTVSAMKTTVITQVNRLNLPHLKTLREILKDLGVETWQIQLTVPTGRVLQSEIPLLLRPPQLAELTEFIVDSQALGEMPHIDTSDTIGYYTEREITLRKRATGQGIWLGCQAGIRAVAVTFDGKVRGCSILPPEFDAGDLHEESLVEIWNDVRRFAYSTAFNPALLEGDCRTCRMGGLCRAGCTAMAFHTTGTVYTNPYCISRPGILGCMTNTSRKFGDTAT